MNHFVFDITNALNKIDRRYVQLIILILSLSLLVIGAGAPGGGGLGNPGNGG